MARILHLLSQRPGRSGSGVFLQAMVREAARRGYTQHVIAAGPPGTSAGELSPLPPDAFTLIPFPSPDAPFPLPGNSDVMPYPSTVFSQMKELQMEQYLAASRRVMLEVRERFRPELIHAHHLWVMTSLARSVFSDIPMVATSHNAELRQLIKAPHLAPRVLPGIRSIDRVCVLTSQSFQDTIDAYGVDESSLAITGAGYRDDLFHLPSEPRAALRGRLRQQYGITLPEGPEAGRIVTFVGLLSTAKGIPFLLEAVALARQRGAPPFHLVLVGATGSGEDGQRMGERVRAAGASVLHVGAQSPECVANILQCSDLFVLPSLFEGLPLVMLEAAACGCPCLVSGLPTIQSWVPAQWLQRGHLAFIPQLATTDADCPVAEDVPRFVAAIADGIASMLSRPRGASAQAELASQLQEHSWSAVFERYEAIYRRLLERAPAAR